MLSFRFTINDSFRAYSTHPITVPKSQVSYGELGKEKLNAGDLQIIWPKGERSKGHMYYGEAGYGPYYQIRTHSDQSPPQYLAEGDEVLIVLVNDHGSRYALVEYRE